MRTIIICLAVSIFCLLVGFGAGQLTRESIATWYPTLLKSPLTPPKFVFPLAWTVLYILMGTSLGLVLASDRPWGLLPQIFLAQLALNFLWSLAFFRFHSPLVGLVIIGLLLVLIGSYCFLAQAQYPLAALLFLPYLGWVVFAAYLNFYIYVKN